MMVRAQYDRRGPVPQDVVQAVEVDTPSPATGEALLEAAIAQSRAWPGVLQVQLAVSVTAPAAQRLYERLGFRVWGCEPRSVGWQGRYPDERHMVLHLDGVTSALDHLVIVAPSLDEGAAYVRDALGVEPFEGGRHRELGTHNRLLRLGHNLFLEVIAPDPASSHTGPRVFGIGNEASVRSVWDAGRRLRAFVARTGSLDAAAGAHGDVLGALRHVTRGERAWRMLIPLDGGLPLAGAAPTLVEYERGMVPAAHMPESGCSLVELVVACPDASEVAAVHRGLGLGGAVTVREAPETQLVAVVSTPRGLATLT